MEARKGSKVEYGLGAVEVEEEAYRLGKVEDMVLPDVPAAPEFFSNMT